MTTHEENDRPRLRPPVHLWNRVRPVVRELRKRPTAAEDKLWQHLRGERLGGFKFRRQHAIDRFIVDFYCPRARLVVEVDGDVHDDQVQQDIERAESLERLGLRVIRFRNEKVIYDVEEVLSLIRTALI